MCIYSEDPERGSIIHLADSVGGGGGLCIHLADPEGVVCNRLADPEGGRGRKLKWYMFASLHDYFIYCFDC